MSGTCETGPRIAIKPRAFPAGLALSLRFGCVPRGCCAARWTQVADVSLRGAGNSASAGISGSSMTNRAPPPSRSSYQS